MEEKKKFINPVSWARHSFILALIGVSIYFLLGFAELAFIFLLTCFIGGLVSVIGLLVTKERTKKPYIYAATSIIAAIILSIVLNAGFKHNIRIAMKFVCDSNIEHLSKTILQASGQSNNMLKKDSWCDLIQEEIGYDSTFKCPADKTGPCSYAMNENIPADANELPPDLVLLFESAPGWNQTGGPDDVVTDRHGQPGANIAFADGHVEFVKAEDIPNLRWTVENKSVERQ
jgi:prepilin-type processing-associated H-X9-DG protein